MIIIAEILKDCETCLHYDTCFVIKELAKVPATVWENHVDIYENECISYLPIGLVEQLDEPFDKEECDSICLNPDNAVSKVFNLYPSGDDIDNPISYIAQGILEFMQRNSNHRPLAVCISEETQKNIMEYYNRENHASQASSLLYFDVGIAQVPVKIDNNIAYGNYEIEY